MTEVSIPIGRLQVATPITMAAAVNTPTVARDAVDARSRLMAGQALATMDPEMFAGPAQEAVEAAVIDGAMVYSTDTSRIITGMSADVPMVNGDTLLVLDKRVAINDCENAVALTTSFWDAGTWTNALMPTTNRPVLRLTAASGVQGRAFITSADYPAGDIEMKVLQRTFGQNSQQCGITLRGRVTQSGYTIGSGGGAGNPRLTIYRRVEGVSTFAAGITWNFPFGSTYEEHSAWIRARVDGGRVRAKAWRYSEPEPAGWMLDWTDPSPLQPGWAGVFNADLTTADWARVSWDANGGTAP